MFIYIRLNKDISAYNEGGPNRETPKLPYGMRPTSASRRPPERRGEESQRYVYNQLKLELSNVTTA